MPTKTIRSKADLAINGAPPAFDEPLHVGRPNITNREAFLQRIEQILDNQWLTNNGPVVQEFERRIADYLGVKHYAAMCNGTNVPAKRHTSLCRHRSQSRRTAGLPYGAIFDLICKHMAHTSEEQQTANNQPFQSCNEALAGIKESRLPTQPRPTRKI